MNDRGLEGKVALVTGGSWGLGAAIAEALAGEGSAVAISYVSSGEKAQAVAERVAAKGVQAAAFQAVRNRKVSSGRSWARLAGSTSS
jgi:NAD(P)-dependent dehydrogenase (short-subunit alcohol dehydrogenase family)